MKYFKRWWGRILLFVILIAAMLYAFWPRAAAVDIGAVTRGPMQVTVEDDGETRVREIYTISAPFSARILRIEGEPGDAVTAGETVLTTLMPAEPAFLDTRTRSELTAAQRAAESGRERAAAEIERIEAELQLARRDYARYQALSERNAAPRAQLERAEAQLRALEAAMVEARAMRDAADYEVERARAALTGPGAGDGADPAYALPAPVSGQILAVREESEAVIPAGTPLMDIGDPADLEIVADLLSTDAVKVTPGDPVLIERWGGGETLNGAVRRVEPFGFTKISALGIEEQRVNVIIDFTDPREAWSRLGHGYRVEVAVILWRDGKALRAPVSALFRDQDQWAVFAVRDGRARLTPVSLGRMNQTHAEIAGGLEEGERLVLHPSDALRDGDRLVDRRTKER